MNIAIISDWNIAGQPTYLMRAINKYTDHKARCIIAYDDSFKYDKDILLDSKEAKEEAAEWCKKADFFHFGRTIFNWPGIDFNELVTRENCCIKYYGSELRQNYDRIKKFHDKTGLAAITGTDWTITGRLPSSFYHLSSYFTKYGDMDERDIPWCDYGDKLKICAGSAGHPDKGYDFLHQVVQELQHEGVPVDLEVISQVSNEECLNRKLRNNCTFTSLFGGWGISGVESMYIGHMVLSCLDPWVMCLYPDNPTILVDRNNLKERIKQYELMTQSVEYFGGLDSRKFAIKNFNTRTVLKRYLYLFDLIMNGKQYIQGRHLPKIIYDF
jgi:hypothetical protein